MSLPQLLNQTIVVYNKASYDPYGREVLGSGQNVLARFQRVTKSRFLPNQQVVTIDAIAYIDGEASINVNDKVTYAGENFKVHGKSIAVDGQGNFHHTKVELIKVGV